MFSPPGEAGIFPDGHSQEAPHLTFVIKRHACLLQTCQCLPEPLIMLTLRGTSYEQLIVHLTTPSWPSRIQDMCFWKCSGADEIPKQYSPNGIIKVVRREDSLDSGICQNPALALSLENILAPASCPNVCSTDGRGCFSLITDLFSSVRSVQILTASALGHHNHGCTPCCRLLHL